MKVIVTGATGLVGRSLVEECIANPRITHALVLTRRPIAQDAAAHSKITEILHDDFGAYPPELMAKLEGAEGCLWALGGPAHHFPDLATATKVQVDYTLAAAQAFLTHLAKPGAPPFRLVFCSGAMAEWDQSASLYLYKDTRRIKGQVEKALLELADGHRDALRVWCVRPSYISVPDAGLAARAIRALSAGIAADRLATAMVKILVDGWETRIVEKEVLAVLGQPNKTKTVAAPHPPIPTCPPCFTSTEWVPGPCGDLHCTGPSTPAADCTVTLDMWPRTTTIVVDTTVCSVMPTLTRPLPCPTAPPCNESDCAVVTVGNPVDISAGNTLLDVTRYLSICTPTQTPWSQSLPPDYTPTPVLLPPTDYPLPPSISTRDVDTT
ncbi:NAD(P)-binding domain protein [Niveomyces insectorum RCEF 264]|uniref:NAD(P)-binding domain protein n=1 Tax=Niveomyces insectorum RCEF 264 TaxID=1081102 RepID=A0A167YUC3_9HYPO|nr:NAD(P)-binding domain protein [Niveomyces insectorum RCEF 264]